MNKEDFIDVINGLDIKTIEGFCLKITNSDNEKGFIQQGLEYIELQQRIDKAIEYMERRDLEWGSKEHDRMMRILRGEDNE